jgi:DNA repair protein RecO (recombination protein O)
MVSGGRPSETEALVLRRTPYAEADWIVTLFTGHFGKVSALARSARKSKHRFAGGLEPFHNLTIQLKASRSEDLMQLTDASISRPRHGLTSNLLAMQCAGKGLGWLSRTFPSKLADAAAWQLIQRWLDALDVSVPTDPSGADTRLAEFGLKLLNVLGWSLEFQKCVRCEKPCPESSSAFVSPRDGGVVCRACGGNGPVLGASLRNALSRASRLDSAELVTDESAIALSLVERALLSHAGIESSK